MWNGKHRKILPGMRCKKTGDFVEMFLRCGKHGEILSGVRCEKAGGFLDLYVRDGE